MWDFPLILSILLFSFLFLHYFLSLSFSLSNPCSLYRLVIHCLATPVRQVWRHVHRHTITCRRHGTNTYICAKHTHTNRKRYGVSRAGYSSIWDAHRIRSETPCVCDVSLHGTARSLRNIMSGKASVPPFSEGCSLFPNARSCYTNSFDVD